MEKKRLTKKTVENLQEQVFQYEVTLTKILPREVAHQNNTLTEEIGILLFQRDCLEKEFLHCGTSVDVAPLWQRTQELDKILIKQRWMILHHAHKYYKQERERLQMPRAYWWWYLDKLESGESSEWVMTESKMSGRCNREPSMDGNVKEMGF